MPDSLWDNIKAKMARDERFLDNDFGFVDPGEEYKDQPIKGSVYEMECGDTVEYKLLPHQYVLVGDDDPILNSVIIEYEPSSGIVRITAKKDVTLNTGNLLASLDVMRYRQGILELNAKRAELLAKYNIEEP